MVLNMITVASMVQMGKVFGNRMVDLQPRSAKLVARAQRLVGELGRVSPAQAELLLKAAGGNAKTAIVMARKRISKNDAVQRLKKNKGRLYLSLQ
jgi:N-acetylmuramic acid 6-phosphate etherase